MIIGSVIKPVIGSVIGNVLKKSGGDVIPPPITAIQPEGWIVIYPDPPAEFDPDFSAITFTARRQGYGSDKSVQEYLHYITVTKRVREVWPDNLTLTADEAAIDECLFSTDEVVSATNNSTKISPTPIVQWGILNRQLIGNSLFVEVLAFHYNGGIAGNGEQIACVEFTATDGVTTVTEIVNNSGISPQGIDRQPVISYYATMDLSTLNNGDITVNAKVYPLVGDAPSIADSSLGTEGARGFTPLLFVKNTTKFASPPLVYVSTSGTDATVLASGATSGGIQKVSTDPVVAKANPFATAASAINALDAATSITGGFTDGCEVRFMAGTHTTFSSTLVGTYSDKVPLVLTRDPDTAFNTVTLSFSTAWNPRHSRVDYRGLQITRTVNTGILTLTGSGLRINLINCTFNGGGFIAPININSSVIVAHGCTFNNCPSGVFNPSTAEYRQFRGCVFNMTTQVEGWSLIGCTFEGNTAVSYGARSLNGLVHAYNIFYKQTSTFELAQSTGIMTNIAIVQNVLEWNGASGGVLYRLSGDTAAFGINHAVVIYNTSTGFFTDGRWNCFYNDTPAPSNRTQEFIRFEGNIIGQLNTKHDIFAGANHGYVDASGRIGGWSFLFGVGCRCNFVQFLNATSELPGPSSSFAQEYPGMDCQFGTSNSIRLDPLFVNYRGTFATASAGVGNGNYRLQAGSPAKNMTRRLLSHDLDGVIRNSTTSAGAYQ